MLKNVASQKVAIFAWDTNADSEKTGDAANITAQISKDGGACAASNDANPTELDATDAPGVYLFDTLQAETNANLFILFAKSSTGNIKIEPVIIHTVRADLAVIATDAARLTAVRAAVLTDLINDGRLDQLIDSIIATVDHADHGLAKLVRSTTPANKLDVSNTGEVGLDFDNIKDASGAKTLTNITVPVVTGITNVVVTDAASRTASKANVTNLDVAVSSRSSHSVAEIVTAIFGKTGITVGGAVTFANIIKAIYAKSRGQADKSGDDVSYKDDDDTTEVFKHSYTTTKRSVT